MKAEKCGKLHKKVGRETLYSRCEINRESEKRSELFSHFLPVKTLGLC